MNVDDDNVTTARGHARAAWLLFARERRLHATLTGWQTGTAPDGSPQISAEVTGPGAAHALSRFTAGHDLVLGQPGDQRQTVDYSVPGRTACVWRKNGVWVELWCSDTPSTPSPPVQAPVRPVSQKARRGLGGRLPFPRRSKETNPA